MIVVATWSVDAQIGYVAYQPRPPGDRAGRPGMPKFTLVDDRIADVAAFVHTFRAARYDESRLKAAEHRRRRCEGRRGVLQRECASCHSATDDLRGIAAKIADPRLYFVTPDDCFVSLDARTGKERWHNEAAPSASSTS